MSNLEKIKELRQASGAGFKDCASALDESNGDLNKAVEILRIKGISKASKKMSRDAKEGVVALSGDESKTSVIEVNCETDFVAKNEDFTNFVKELSELNNEKNSNIEELKSSKMGNGETVEDNIVALIAKIGEKITIRRAYFFDKNNGQNFCYVHSAIEKNIGKIASIVKLDGEKKDDLDTGNKLAMHIAASNPLSLDKNDLDQEILNKELEIIKAELLNSGKKPEMIEKISQGKLNKFISDNTLLNQEWIMDPKSKVSDVLKGYKIIDFIRYKVGEGV